MAAWQHVRSSLGLPTIVALAVALISVSSSPPLILYAAAPALAIAFWRNTLAVAVLAPVAVTRRRHELRTLLSTADGRRAGLLCVLAGLWLAVHFGTWTPSVKFTSVAAATALVCTQPVWAALIAVVRGVHIPRATWLGMAFAVVGAALATGADLTVSRRAVLGDVLALMGGIAAAFYTTYGQRARASTSTTTYTAICYSVCGLALGVVCLIGGVPVTGFTLAAWLAIGALTLGPQLLGHSLINFALHKVSATTVSVLMLMEVPGAALIGWLWLDQVPPARSVPGIVVLVLGVAIVIAGAGWARRGRRPTTPNPTGRRHD